MFFMLVLFIFTVSGSVTFFLVLNFYETKDSVGLNVSLVCRIVCNVYHWVVIHER